MLRTDFMPREDAGFEQGECRFYGILMNITRDKSGQAAATRPGIRGPSGFVGLALGWVVRSDGVAGVQQVHADAVSHLGLGLDAHDFGDEFQIQRTK
jgi:hypothetical protein